MSKKPLALQYGPDDAPPVSAVLLAATQQVGLMAITLVVPLFLARDSGASASATATLISPSMIRATEDILRLVTCYVL
ncbi:MAG TPA: hypothetical protein VND19_24695 [Acetobacteraceae bacterium]|nr:hypothetical protein [Acetobacteraceae bacterium]